MQQNPHIPKNRLNGELSSCYKIKLLKAGIRLVYQVIDDELVILLVTVGKRADSEVYEEAKHRLDVWLANHDNRPPSGAHTEEGKKKCSQNALKTGEYTDEKVAERKRKAANKRPMFEGGTVFDTYGDKRFKWIRSINYSGFMKTIKKADKEKIKAKLKACVWCPPLWRNWANWFTG